MKKFIIILSLSLFTHHLFAQISEVQKVFDKYQDVEGITSIRIAKPMFNLLNKIAVSDEELKKLQPLLKNVNSLNILITGEMLNKILPSNSNVKLQPEKIQLLQTQINNAVNGLKYEELVTINSGGRRIKLLTNNSKGEVLNNLLLSITGSDQNILMLLDGEVPMSVVSKLISEGNK